MNDFNLRPEIMGFGRPERVLAVPAPTLLPADQWKPHGKSFEVNGLGQLRTALALPASEAEIAASMRHADAAPAPVTGGWDINRDWAIPWMGFDEAAEGGDKTLIFAPFKPNAVLEKLRDDINDQLVKAAIYAVNPPLSMVLGGRRVGKALALDQLRIAAGAMDAQDVPQHGRMFWHKNMLHTDSCACDRCTASSLGGRFSNPTKIMAQTPQGVNYTARYMAMTDAELDATRHTPQECDEDGEAFRRELRIRKL